ncbi:MAG: hypothetical protein IPM54_42565 [Polyangiaceae bacterium]|nr:hypothetical protein [Polyangiaceae bacterium]
MSVKAVRANRRVKASKAKQRLRDWYERGKKKIRDRLDAIRRDPTPRDSGPEFGAKKIHYEASNRVQAITCGGIGAIHQVVQKVGLARAIDKDISILKRHRPYRESDHILNVAYNGLCGAKVLDDIEVRRNDSAFLDAIDARAIPDPTTSGDFFRRFDGTSINQLMDTVNNVRVNVWQHQIAWRC